MTIVDAKPPLSLHLQCDRICKGGVARGNQPFNINERPCLKLKKLGDIVAGAVRQE
jgi:hypothetical protein